MHHREYPGLEHHGLVHQLYHPQTQCSAKGGKISLAHHQVRVAKHPRHLKPSTARRRRGESSLTPVNHDLNCSHSFHLADGSLASAPIPAGSQFLPTSHQASELLMSLSLSHLLYLLSLSSLTLFLYFLNVIVIVNIFFFFLILLLCI